MFMNNPWQHHKIGDQHSSIISVYSPKCLAKLSVFGSTTLHVLLEGLSLRDGLSLDSIDYLPRNAQHHSNLQHETLDNGVGETAKHIVLVDDHE